MTEQIIDSNKHNPLSNYLVIIAGFIILATFGGTRFTFGVFLKPMTSELGWTRGITAGAFSLTGIIQGFAGLVIGRLTDRFGPRIVLTVVGLFMGIGYMLMSQVNDIWQLYLIYGVLIGIGNSPHVPVLSTIVRRFKKRRGLMTGIVMAGAGAGQLIVPPIVALLIDAYDWRISYLLVGIAVLIIMTTASQFTKSPPSLKNNIEIEKKDLQDTEPGLNKISVKDVFKTKQIWIILVIHFFLSYSIAGILVHIVPYATDLGIAPAIAASIISVAGGTLIIARIIIGNAGDRIGEERVYLIGFFLLLIALIGFLFIKQAWGFYLFAICIGFTHSTTMIVSPLIARIYGLKAHATILSMANLTITVGGAVGPYLFGYIHDVTGNYHQAFIISTVIAGIGLVSAIVLVLDKPKYYEIM